LSAPVNDEETIREINQIRDIYQLYELKDQYNGDESALFWKTTPEFTLDTSQQSGIKKLKARVSIMTCSNSNGSDKLENWIIGTAAKPRCFGQADIAMSSLPGH
jgi:hypothetical protein